MKERLRDRVIESVIVRDQSSGRDPAKASTPKPSRHKKFALVVFVEGAHGFYDAVDLGVGEFGIERKRKDFGGGLLGFGKVTFFVAEIFVDGLEVERDGIMDACFDVVGF